MLQMHHENGVVTMVMDSPPLNTLTRASMQDFATVLQKFTAMPLTERPRLLVLTSAVKGVFSMGLEPSELLKLEPNERPQVFSSLMAMCQAVLECPVPLVIDMRGAAIAGGAVLAALGDYVIADARTAKLCFSEVKVNLAVPTPIIQLVARRVSLPMLTDLMVLGRNIAGQELLTSGFAQFMYEKDEDKYEWLTQYAGKYSRLAPDVTGTTLLQVKAPLSRMFKDAAPGMAQAILPFMDEAHIGRGLREAMAKQKG